MTVESAPDPPTLGPRMRGLLIACGPMNLAGAWCFAPPFTAARQAFHLAEPDPFYLWVLSAWILAFGVAYAYQGWTGDANRGVLALGAWGKAAFAVPLIAMAVSGHAPWVVAAAAVPDLVLAAVFVTWLARQRTPARPRGAC